MRSVLLTKCIVLMYISSQYTIIYYNFSFTAHYKGLRSFTKIFKLKFSSKDLSSLINISFTYAQLVLNQTTPAYSTPSPTLQQIMIWICQQTPPYVIVWFTISDISQSSRTSTASEPDHMSTFDSFNTSKVFQTSSPNLVLPTIEIIQNQLKHGFRKRRSCETQLLTTIQEITSNTAKGKQVDVILLDFAKAFDKVSHLRLLHKLDHYDVRGNLKRWIQ